MKEHKATIHKLVKQCAKPSIDWNCFSIKKIQEDIENYDRGMKMLVKIAKNPNAVLYSDVEEKGKGKRLKRPIKYFDDDANKENKLEKKRSTMLSALLPIPKLTNVSKSAQSSQPLLEKEVNVPRETLSNNYMECREVKRRNDIYFLFY